MYSITKDGVCAKHLCVIDEKAKSVSTTEDWLVVDFGDQYGWTFKTGSNCTFKTGSGCTFNTGHYCTFNTGHYCTFNTGPYCTFKTGYNCTFNTGYNCTFKVGDNCCLIRYDLKGVVELMSGVTIRLTDVGYEYNRDEYIETMSVNEEKLVFKLSNEEWVTVH